MPDPVAELYSQALAHHESGDLQNADALYRQILSINPDHEATHIMLGVLAHQVGRNDVAIHLLTRALQLNPHIPDANLNLGVAFFSSGALDQAIASYETALQLRPTDARAHNNLATALRAAGRLTQAVASYAQAIALAPDFAEAHDNLGLLYQQLGDPPKSIAHFRRAIQLAPQSAEFHAHLASALRETGALDECDDAARTALALDPNNVAALTTLGSCLKDSGHLDDALTAYRRAANLPGGTEAADAFLFAIHLHPDYSPRRIAEEHASWAKQFPAPTPNYPNDKSPTRPLRIGYVSPDFRQHVVAYNILPLFENHDRAQFQIFAYSNTPRHDDLTARFRSLSTAWRDVNPQSDAQIANLIVSDSIDILVDLALHTTGNRLGVLALKPAPVQFTFAGYPSTTGLPQIDYRLTDPHLDPPGKHDAFYAEQSVRLPHSFWCYQSHNDLPVQPPPALANGHVTFGYLGAFAKINAPTLDLWSRVLGAVPGSRILLMSRPASPRARTIEFLSLRGIDPNRIDFVDYQPREQYLKTYHRIDVVLDTHPYNGHTTNLDALWTGVPIVSLYGQAAVSRAGLSQLSNLNLADLATDDKNHFVSIAASLASDPARLAKLRGTLRETLRRSPLADATSFARGIETAYRDAWRRFCQTH